MKSGSWGVICTDMFVAMLFTVTKVREQPKCPPVDEWMKKISGIHI